MKIYDVLDPDGHTIAFEVDNLHLQRHGVLHVLRHLPGVRLLSKSGVAASREEFCRFQFGASSFVVSAPDDDSRYWIGTEPPRWVPEIDYVRSAFERTHALLGIVIPPSYERH